MGKGISQRAFGRAIGVRPSAVQKAIASGRISTYRDGTIDEAKARREWRENTLHSKRPPRKKQAPTRQRAPQRRDEGGDGEGLGSMSAEWHRARAAREAIQARLLELDLLKRQGTLIDKEEIGRAFFAHTRRIRDRFQSLPGQIGPEIVGLTAVEAVRLLQHEIDRILDELTKMPEPSKNGDA